MEDSNKIVIFLVGLLIGMMFALICILGSSDICKSTKGVKQPQKQVEQVKKEEPKKKSTSESFNPTKDYMKYKILGIL